MILTAGLGMRLRPLTANLAKPALPVVNIPLVFYTIQLLRNAGIREVILNLHHAPETIKKILGRGRKWKMRFQYSYEPKILGTGGGLKNVENFFEDEPFLVINGDTICEIDLKKAIAFHQERDAIATMVLREDKTPEKYGVIGLDSENRIQRFVDLVKPNQKDLRKFMFTGIHIFSPPVFEYIPPLINCCLNRYVYPRMIENHEGVFGFETKDFWSDLGTLESYFKTNISFMENPDLLSYFDPLANYQYAPKREVDRIIRMGKNVDLKEEATLIDPVVIGDHCQIGKGTILGPNVILGNGCHIEKNNRIENTILWAGSKTHEAEVIQNQIRTKKLQVEIPKGLTSAPRREVQAINK